MGQDIQCPHLASARAHTHTHTHTHTHGRVGGGGGEWMSNNIDGVWVSKTMLPVGKCLYTVSN
jgi:hypothetical protein